jgi:hypothetical protein
MVVVLLIIFIRIIYRVRPASELPLGTEDMFRNADENHDEITDVKFEDCLQSEEKYFDAPYNNNLGNSSESIYEPNRQRVVRFLEEEEDPNGGFMTMSGLAAAGNNGKNLVASGTSVFETAEDDDSSNNSLDEEEEQEKQIRKTLLMAMFGMGFMGLVGFGTKKLMNILSRDRDQDSGAGDIVGDSIDTATHAADSGSSSQAAAQGSFNASASASQTSNTLVVAGVGNSPAAMTAAQ